MNSTNDLDKEQVRDLLFSRFSNVLFDNMWNRDHVQCVAVSREQKHCSNINRSKQPQQQKEKSATLFQ